MRTPLVLALLALAGGCSRDSSPGPVAQPHVQPEAPPGTGTQVIDMDGQWMIFAIERVGGGSTPGGFLGGPTFVPVRVGQWLTIEGGKLRDATGAPLYEPATPDPEDFYTNSSDGRTLWFEVVDFEPEPVSQLSVQAIFGSAGENVIEGFVSALVLGPPIQGQLVGENPNGMFHVWAGRLVPPTLGHPGSIHLPVDRPAVDPPAAAQPINAR